MTSRIFLVAWLLCGVARPALALDRSLFVINGLAETLSRVDVETGTVSNNIALLGLVPNQLYIDNEFRRDTVAYVVNSGSQDLWLLHLATATVFDTIPLGPDRNPYALAFVNDTIVAVTNLLANTISEVNTRAGAVVAEYAVGTAPEGIVFHGGRLFVCNTGFSFSTFTYGQGELAVVDPARDSVIARIPVGTNPQAAVIDYENELLVLCTGDFAAREGRVYIVDPRTFTVKDSVATGGWPGHLALAPDGVVYIAAGGFAGPGEVYLFDSHDHVMLRDASNPLSVSTGVVAVATDLAGRGYACGLSADQVNRLSVAGVTATYNVGDGPGFAAVWEPNPPGDVDGSRAVTTADIIYLVNYLFKGGPLPPYAAMGDVNRNCVMSLSDAVTIINYMFRAGPPLRYGCR